MKRSGLSEQALINIMIDNPDEVIQRPFNLLILLIGYNFWGQYYAAVHYVTNADKNVP